MYKCKTCDSKFESEKRRPKYCSHPCNPKRNKTCGYCDQEFVDASRQNSSKFCTTTCRRKAKEVRKAKKAGKEPPVFLDEQEWFCDLCGGRYTPVDSSQKYCSDQCREDQYHYEKYEGVPDHLSRTVKCRECGEKFRGCIPHGGRSGSHLEASHGLTTEEYKDKYPDASLYCEASLWKQHQKTWSMDDDQREFITNRWREFYAENDTWNKGLTADDHPSVAAIAEAAAERLSVPENNPFYGKTHTEETKQYLSEVIKDKLENDEEYRRNFYAARQKSFEEGVYISGIHQALMDAMRDAGIYDEYGFAPEQFVTLLDGTKHPIDIASREHKIAIEVDGCFYHGCPEHGNFDKLSSDWQSAVERTKQRDALIDQSLEKYGWVVVRFWEHDIVTDIDKCVEHITFCLTK